MEHTVRIRADAARFLREEKAQAGVEYILAAAVLVAASYAAVKLFSYAWRVRFERVAAHRAGPFP